MLQQLVDHVVTQKGKARHTAGKVSYLIPSSLVLLQFKASQHLHWG